MRPWTLALAAVAALVVAAATFVLVTGDEPTATTVGGAPSPATSVPAATTPPRTPAQTAPERSSPTASASTPVSAEGVLVIWARGDLTRGFAEVLGAIPEVTAVAHVRSDTLGLVGSRTAGGRPVDTPSDGFRIPVEVAAVDPVEYVPTLPRGAGRDAVEALTQGRVLLSETGARLRGIDVGGSVDLVGLSGLEVAGIVPDGTVGRAEIVLHAAHADAAGLDEDGTVFLRHDAAPGAETTRLIEHIEELVPPDLTARIVDAAAGEPRRQAPLVLSLAQVKGRFGEFAFRPREGTRDIDIDPAFRAAHIVTVDVPVLGAVTCHEGIVEDLRDALRRVVDEGHAAEIDPGAYGGCYYPRRISTSTERLSHHSWGIALDINVDLSLPDLGPPPSPEVIAAFEAHGFRWGGDFLTPDNHHFEWVGEVTEPPASTRD